MLEDFRKDRISVDEVVTRLAFLPYQDIGFAKVDHHRALRKGFPEVIFGQGKSPDQIVAVAKVLLEKADRILVTKADPDAFDAVKDVISDAAFDPIARVIVVDRRSAAKVYTGVTVVSAGTADLPVATEAAITAELVGCQVERLTDVGVAGLHRLLDTLSILTESQVVIVIAGMEGALPSVVGGLVGAPVIAVPTSVGYGTGLGGVAALMGMLNSCAPGMAVVNIDNGFGAGYLAGLIVSRTTVRDLE